VDVADSLQRAIATVCDLDAARVKPDTNLEDLGVDSLAVAEIIVELEIEFNRELPVHFLRRLDRVKTVGDVAVELQAALGDEERGESSTERS
jgi:acyl carrier protein